MTTRLALEILILIALPLAVHLVWRRRYRLTQADHDYLRSRIADIEVAHQRAFLRENARRRAVLDGMSEGLAVLDASGRIEFSNAPLRRMLGLKDEGTGRTMLEVLRHPQVVHVLAHVQRDGLASSEEFEFRNGVTRQLQIDARVLEDELGHRLGTVLVLHDVTRLKQLENTRKEFVASVSHELRTPLTLISGYVETLLDGAVDEPEQARRFLEKVQRHCERLTVLIEDILTLSSLETGKMSLRREQVDVSGLVAELCEDLRRPAAARQVWLYNEVPSGLTVHADAARLGQVFSNLVDNAVKYGRPGGWVRIGGREMNEREVELWVADNGPGIPPEAKERVFERFYRVEPDRARKTGGTGLGLAIVKHIVQLHGGEVALDSEPGKGCRFAFTLPAAAAEPGPEE
jgi:two-component system phosphate regulon sensor histidine kinase PhoR